jgi:hypothetical protein
MLIVQETSIDTFVEIMQGTSFKDAGGVLHGWDVTQMWTDEELAGIGVYRIQPAAITEGRTPTGYTFSRDGAGAISQVLQYRDVTFEDVQMERERRLGLGFDYNFDDARGVHRIATAATDMVGWDEVTKYANALLSIGDTTTTIGIVTDTGEVQVTAPDWMKVLIVAAQFRQPIWKASFILQAQSPIPTDYTNDAHWPSVG